MKIPRGTFDILPPEVETWQWIEAQAKEVCRRYGYSEARTPIFEQTALFERGVGETTDVVEKEMYTFQDRGNRSLTLRPEGTAGLVRSFVEQKVYAQNQLTKWFYMGPMFRYERPQAGRTRQFHQFGVEAIGSSDPVIDAEVIALAMDFFQALGLKQVRLEINNVGDIESREHYFEKLIQYFIPYEHELHPDARSRLLRNPMRILDSKDPRTQEIAQGAPSIFDFLSKENRAHFENVLKYLDQMNIPYVVNDRMVRGLDYYTLTAFEFMADLPGEQAGTLGGGGRYNGLVQELGGPEMPGIGFAMGIERILLALEEERITAPQSSSTDCFFIALGEEAKQFSMQPIRELRQAGLVVERDYLDRKLKGQLKAADRVQSRYAVILGEEEIQQGQVQVRDMATGEQVTLPFAHLVGYLKEKCQRETS